MDLDVHHIRGDLYSTNILECLDSMYPSAFEGQIIFRRKSFCLWIEKVKEE